MSGTSVVVYTPKKKPTIKTFQEIHPPVDFSFYHLENIGDAKEEEPRLPVSPRGKGKHPPAEEEGIKSSGRSLKLNNNSISNFKFFIEFTQIKFTNWQDIAWIDLSQNELTTIGPELTEFVNLQILYLHGNQIGDEQLVEQLQPLKHLRKLTLHGNPVEKRKGYRWLVLSKLPNLQSLDFSCVTKADRKTANTWEKMSCWGQKKKKKVEDED